MGQVLRLAGRRPVAATSSNRLVESPTACMRNGCSEARSSCAVAVQRRASRSASPTVAVAAKRSCTLAMAMRLARYSSGVWLSTTTSAPAKRNDPPKLPRPSSPTRAAAAPERHEVSRTTGGAVKDSASSAQSGVGPSLPESKRPVQRSGRDGSSTECVSTCRPRGPGRAPGFNAVKGLVDRSARASSDPVAIATKSDGYAASSESCSELPKGRSGRSAHS